MADPTQAGAPEQLPEPTMDTYTPEQLVQIINNGAARYTPSHPQYGQVRQVMMQARQALALKMAEANHADSLAAQTPGPTSSTLMGAAEGMSGGLATPLTHGLSQLGLNVGDPQLFAQASREQFPGHFFGGSAAGGAIPATILAALGVQPNVAMGIPAGMQEGFETGSAGKGVGAGVAAALVPKAVNKITKTLGINALAGKAVGALANQFGGKVAPGLLSKPAARAAAAIGAEVGEEGEMIGGKAVSEIRKQLTKQKFGTPAQIEDAINTMRQQAQRQASGGVTLTAKGGEAMETPTFIRRGGAVRPDQSALGETRFVNIKEAPPAQSIGEVQSHLDQLRARFAKRGFGPEVPGTGEVELPQPHGATLTPKGASAPSAEETAPQSPFAPARTQSAAILELEDRLGRGLTEAERAQLAARNAYNLSQAAGRSPADATAAAKRAAGATLTPWDPRIGL